jgi:vesicle transport through interaction with t-SNAREs protein 1
MAFLLLQLHGVDDGKGKSKKVSTAMSRRMSRNKWIIGTIIYLYDVALILNFKLSY